MNSSDDGAVIADLAPPRAFDQACRMVVDYLAESVPLGAWAVTRVAAGWQTVLVAHDRDYGLAPGFGNRWTETMCQTMVTGDTPRVVPDTSAVPQLQAPAESAAALDFPVAAYVGTPIVQPGGELFGTLIGLNKQPMGDGFVSHEGLLDLLSSLLSSVLEADTNAVDHARELERAVSDAETDQLTGLLNRRGWTRWLEREEERFRRFGDPACVLMMDLDGLKEVNDTQGHDAGDRFLQRTAETLRAATRHGDPLARLGGDEFAMVATVGPDDAGPLVARLQRVLDDAGTPCSIGVAPVGLASGFSEAISEADAAMYTDKRARKGARVTGS
ncbi:sensor domain-containing diguanylate cyclase [Actinomycetospora termitidis]|uniref:GGDEF domain-containing protein n=1 Tax=Actinomycetospora termitidis TaxID=3053470 RepID=A0ABT7MDE6_9PSEU|nr:GGDEF domain-containing protein [Actinomycetospora sp. Odt1-22]MDL5158689.1 GGDEF domain-containing protein [Actinomycetospora sp. Odt1-22]